MFISYCCVMMCRLVFNNHVYACVACCVVMLWVWYVRVVLCCVVVCCVVGCGVALHDIVS